MKLDLVIKGGEIVVPGLGLVKGNVGVKEGRIAALSQNYQNYQALESEKEIDADGLHILPGLIDPHVHLGFGGPLDREFRTESASASAGGVTTMLITLVSSKNYMNLPRRIATGQENSLVDFSFHLGVLSEEHLEQLAFYREEFGITSFKFFMGYKGEEARQLGISSDIDDGFLLESFAKIAQLKGGVALVHAENIEICLRRKKKLMSEGREGLTAWNEARPDFAEGENINRALYLSKVTGCPVYIVHMSTEEGYHLLAQHKKTTKTIYGETCPHYLTHTDDSPVGNLGKVNPPLRKDTDREALWKGIKDGEIDTVGSDHCSYKRERKTGSLWEAMPGFPGVSTILPVMLSEGVNKGRMTLQRLVEITSYNTAKIFNLYPAKGTIQIGSDADLVLVDLTREQTLRPEHLHSNADFSIYENWNLKGWPVMTLVRGRVTMQNGEILDGSGNGRFIKR